MADLSMILLLDQSNLHFDIGFENETQYGFVMEGEVTFNEQDPVSVEMHLESGARKKWKQFPFDYINDYPHVELKIFKQTTQGLESDFFVKLKPKPKHLLSVVALPKWDLKKGKKYILWSEKEENSEKIQIPTVKKHIKKRDQNKSRNNVFTDLSQLAFFQQELDLHAEALFDNLDKIRSEDIYHKQLSAFSNYMDKAIELEVERVFIIHGIGSGRLKKSIHQKLSHNPNVVSYSNAYHHKYGFGATEVLFQ